MDTLLFVEQYLCPPSSQALPTILLRPKYRRSPGTPIQSSRQSAAAVQRPPRQHPRKSRLRSPTPESTPPSSLGEYIPKSPARRLCLPPQGPQPARPPFHSPFPPTSQPRLAFSLAAQNPLALRQSFRTPASATHLPQG